MADVQREHGYTGVANRLLEAIIEAGFSERQIRILLVLMRLTYGWRRATVLLTELQLARRSGGASERAPRASGSWRGELHDLIENRVIARVETADRGVFTWAINKDFEQWGRFARAIDYLASQWDERPRQARGAHDAVKDHLAQPRATSIDENERHDWPKSGPDGEDEWPNPRPDSGPALGQSVAQEQATKPDLGVENQGLRASERNGKKEKENSTTTTATRSREEDDVVNAYALRLTAAANAGITRRWGEQPNPMHFGQAMQLASDLIAADIPVEVATDSIARQCAAKRGEKPGTIEYFRLGIVDHNRRRIQREFDAANPVEARGTGGEPTRIHIDQAALTQQRQVKIRTDAEIQAEYDRERRKAVDAWATANPARYREIVAKANEERREMLRAAGCAESSPLGTRARDAKIATQCGAAVNFPTFDAWRAAKTRQTTPSTPSPPSSPTT